MGLQAQTPATIGGFPVLFDETISFAGVGDVMLGSWVIPIIETTGVSYPFDSTAKHLQSADICIANLEAPFTDDGEVFDKQYNFKVPPEFAPGLREAGISVVTLGNNHIMDFGEKGLVTTMATLDALGILHCGAGKNFEEAHAPSLLKAGEKTIAFFGYSMTFPVEFYARGDTAGTAYPEPKIMQKNLEFWEPKTDFTIVSFHWSAEKLETPKTYQTEYAHLAIDSGADLVLGHHPHVLQGMEIYENRLIAYSLGNFAFGSYSNHARDSIILKIHLDDEGMIYAKCIPINVDNHEVQFQPRILVGAQKENVITKLQQLSRPLNRGQSIIDDHGFILGDWSRLTQVEPDTTLVSSF